jgi:hypothetical protein
VADLSGDVYCAWQGNDLIFAARVTDDVLKRDSTNIWDDDGVEIGIDGLGDGFNWGSADDHQFTVVTDGTVKDLGANTGATAVARPVSGGWAVELRLPASVLNGGTLFEGRSIRFNVGLNDDDDGGSRDDWLTWRGSSTNSNSQNFGALILNGAPTPATATPTVTSTPTATPTKPPTSTPTAAATASSTLSPSVTSTPSRTPTATLTETLTPTAISLTPTATATPSPTVTLAPTATATRTPTPSATATYTPSRTATASATPTLTSTPIVTMTCTPTITPTGAVKKNYLPLMLRGINLGIYGKVTYEGAPAAGIWLALSFFDGSNWSDAGTAITGSDGAYTFRPPSLPSGQRYSVAYFNGAYGNVSDPRHLDAWLSFDINNFAAGSSVPGGDFDITDVELQLPAPDSTVSLPYTFRWQSRAATPSDSYEFELSEPGVQNWYYSPGLGWTESYTLTQLPSGFVPGVSYSWYVWVYAPDGGMGIPYDSHPVTFANAGVTSGDLIGEPVHANSRIDDLNSILQERESSTLPEQ